MDTVYYGDISNDFKGKPLIPIVYSHGVCSNRTMHSGTCRDLASHGYIVFALDHNDGTSSYVRTLEGKEMHYDNMQAL